MSDYNWTKVWDDNQIVAGHFDGHTVFKDEISKRYSITDMSGDLPHETDDGVLWFDFDRVWKFDLYARDNYEYGRPPMASVQCLIPVLKEFNPVFHDDDDDLRSRVAVINIDDEFLEILFNDLGVPPIECSRDLKQTSRVMHKMLQMLHRITKPSASREPALRGGSLPKEDE